MLRVPSAQAALDYAFTRSGEGALASVSTDTKMVVGTCRRQSDRRARYTYSLRIRRLDTGEVAVERGSLTVTRKRATWRRVAIL
jgi:hypothetical protein